MNDYLRSTGPVKWKLFLENMGICPTTGWRWRKRGWVNTVNISGIQYIMPTAIADFNRRAEDGEFAKKFRPIKKHHE